jgi:hypothetical protein
LPRRKIDRESDVLGPILCIAHRLFEQTVGHLADHARVFGDRDEDVRQKQAALWMLRASTSKPTVFRLWRSTIG